MSCILTSQVRHGVCLAWHAVNCVHCAAPPYFIRVKLKLRFPHRLFPYPVRFVRIDYAWRKIRKPKSKIVSRGDAWRSIKSFRGDTRSSLSQCAYTTLSPLPFPLETPRLTWYPLALHPTCAPPCRNHPRSIRTGCRFMALAVFGRHQRVDEGSTVGCHVQMSPGMTFILCCVINVAMQRRIFALG